MQDKLKEVLYQFAIMSALFGIVGGVMALSAFRAAGVL